MSDMFKRQSFPFQSNKKIIVRGKRLFEDDFNLCVWRHSFLVLPKQLNRVAKFEIQIHKKLITFYDNTLLNYLNLGMQFVQKSNGHFQLNRFLRSSRLHRKQRSNHK